MLCGLMLDNVPIGHPVPDSSFAKLRAMRARTVGLLWTPGTHHGRDVYDRCERELGDPLYLLRVTPETMTADGFFSAADDAMVKAPLASVREHRFVVVVHNEPNIEHFAADPEGYGRLFADVRNDTWPATAFAWPSTGIDGWLAYARAALKAAGGAPKCIAVNLYDVGVHLISLIAKEVPGATIYVTEVNTLQPNRVDWLKGALQELADNGVAAATIFIAGGTPGYNDRGEENWPSKYVISQDEAVQLPGEVAGRIAPPEEVTGVVIKDATGYDIWPLVTAAADRYNINPVLVLACLKAESGLDPYAKRNGTWPDVSFGMAQVTVQTAGGYGVGDGSNSTDNITAVWSKLSDPSIAIDLAARILSGCWAESWSLSDAYLQTLIAYNSGAPQTEGNWYWQKYAANVANYRAALAWAEETLGAAPVDDSTKAAIRANLDALWGYAGEIDAQAQDIIKRGGELTQHAQSVRDHVALIKQAAGLG